MHRFLVVGAAALAALALSAPAGAWTWPADGSVLRPFGVGPDPYAGGQHRGVDVAGVEGTAVRAPAAGTVTFAGALPTHGRGVTITTDDGYAVTLVHLGAIGIEKGATVAEGAAVGTMGWSGTAEHSVPSVHLGVRRTSDPDGYVDPLGLLPPRSAPRTELTADAGAGTGALPCARDAAATAARRAADLAGSLAAPVAGRHDSGSGTGPCARDADRGIFSTGASHGRDGRGAAAERRGWRGRHGARVAGSSGRAYVDRSTEWVGESTGAHDHRRERPDSATGSRRPGPVEPIRADAGARCVIRWCRRRGHAAERTATAGWGGRARIRRP